MDDLQEQEGTISVWKRKIKNEYIRLCRTRKLKKAEEAKVSMNSLRGRMFDKNFDIEQGKQYIHIKLDMRTVFDNYKALLIANSRRLFGSFIVGTSPPPPIETRTLSFACKATLCQ